MSPKVSVVIPFFQRENGVLRKAVMSVLGQANFTDYDIIITDDESPINPEEELADLLETHGHLIRILKQKNAGPGAARNKCLDAVRPGTEYVAFLDSDDEWTKSHLENAIFALDKGYDIYFADVVWYNQKSYFYKIIPLLDHILIAKERQLYELKGNMFDDLLHSNFIFTSTFVYRYKEFQERRFCDELYNGQDYVFWLDLSLITKKVSFSLNIDALMEKGVNIWSGAVPWGSKERSRFQSNFIKLDKFIAKRYTLSPSQARYIEKLLSGLRYEFAEVLMHDLRRPNNLNLKILLNHFRVDPLTYVYLFPNCVKIFMKRYFHR